MNFLWFGPAEGPNFELFNKAADQVRDHYHAFHAPVDCAPRFETRPGTFNIYRQFDSPHVTFVTEREYTVEALIAWLAEHTLPTVSEYDLEMAALIFDAPKGDRNAVILFSDDESRDEPVIA